MNRALQTETADAHEPAGDQHVELEPAKYLRQFQICQLLDISDETWRRWRQSGKAPRPVALPGVPRWRKTDIERFERGRQADHGKSFFASAIRRRS